MTQSELLCSESLVTEASCADALAGRAAWGDEPPSSSGIRAGPDGGWWQRAPCRPQGLRRCPRLAPCLPRRRSDGTPLRRRLAGRRARATRGSWRRAARAAFAAAVRVLCGWSGTSVLAEAGIMPRLGARRIPLARGSPSLSDEGLSNSAMDCSGESPPSGLELYARLSARGTWSLGDKACDLRRPDPSRPPDAATVGCVVGGTLLVHSCISSGRGVRAPAVLAADRGRWRPTWLSAESMPTAEPKAAPLSRHGACAKLSVIGYCPEPVACARWASRPVSQILNVPPRCLPQTGSLLALAARHLQTMQTPGAWPVAANSAPRSEMCARCASATFVGALSMRSQSSTAWSSPRATQQKGGTKLQFQCFCFIWQTSHMAAPHAFVQRKTERQPIHPFGCRARTHRSWSEPHQQNSISSSHGAWGLGQRCASPREG